MVLNDFDRQTITLSPDSLIMDSPLELTQYRIVSWQLVYYDEGLYESENWITNFHNIDDENNGIKMEVTFQRILTNELLTTYLPSFFLLGICYATTFFKQYYFEAAVTVNLTVMLVATTLFIRYLDLKIQD